MSVVRVTNTEPNLKTLGFTNEKDYSSISLKPGVNEVDSALWERIVAKDNIVQFWVKSGVLVVSGDAKKPALPFSELPVADAITLVTDTFDVALLNDWRASERRGGVLAAIEKQIQLIENPNQQ